MRVIQVGIGGMGNAWLNVVRQSEDVEFAGFVEVSPRVIAEQTAKYDLDPRLIFASVTDALNAVQAEGIINVTPPQFHKDVSIAALAAGVPVLSEKPLAGTREDAQAIVDKADETGVLHMVAQNYRYHVPIQTVKQVLDSGQVGEIGAVTVDFFKGPHFGGFREEMRYPLIIDMAIHHFDLMRFFLGSDPVSVFGRSWNPGWSWFRHDASAAVSLRFSNGAVAAYNGSWCSTGQETPWNANWRFECERGVVTLRDDQVTVQNSQTAAGTGGSGSLTPVQPVVMERQAQAYLLHEFYESVTQRKVPPTTCQDNIKSLGLVFDVIDSFETGATVHVNG